MTCLRRTWAVLTLCAMGLTGCPGFGDRTLTFTGDVPTWEGDIKALFEARCTTCHGDPPVAGAPYPLLTFEQAVERSSRIYARSVTVREMPPGGGLDDSEAAMLKAWLDNGTPRGEAQATPDAEVMGGAGGEGGMGGAMAGAGGMIAGDPTYDGQVKAILDGSCAFPGCHGGDAPAVNLDLTSYAGFTAGGLSGVLTSDSGDPADSLLIKRVRALDGFTSMPPGSMLPADQLDILDAWIAAGAPEN
ncbi:MAG: c-type cytochrome domain-containing protein [Bradymonadia bacterium]